MSRSPKCMLKRGAIGAFGGGLLGSFSPIAMGVGAAIAMYTCRKDAVAPQMNATPPPPPSR